MPHLILLLARILLSAIFIMSGVGKIFDIAGTAGYIGSVGLPQPVLLAWVAAIFETVAGLMILFGYLTRPTALVLAGFCLFTGFMFHFDPANQMQMISFMKNLGLAGGFLALMGSGPGGWSVDARRDPRAL